MNRVLKTLVAELSKLHFAVNFNSQMIGIDYFVLAIKLEWTNSQV